jgi:hypothetical protein
VPVGRPATGSETARATWPFVSRLVATGKLDDATYARLAAVLGERGMVDMVLLVGYYLPLAVALEAFRAAPRSGSRTLRRAAGRRRPVLCQQSVSTPASRCHAQQDVASTRWYG